MSAQDLSGWFAERESWKERVWGTRFDAPSPETETKDDVMARLHRRGDGDE